VRQIGYLPELEGYCSCRKRNELRQEVLQDCTESSETTNPLLCYTPANSPFGPPLFCYKCNYLWRLVTYLQQNVYVLLSGLVFTRIRTKIRNCCCLSMQFLLSVQSIVFFCPCNCCCLSMQFLLSVHSIAVVCSCNSCCLSIQLLLSVHAIAFICPCNCCCLSMQLLLSLHAIAVVCSCNCCCLSMQLLLPVHSIAVVCPCNQRQTEGNFFYIQSVDTLRGYRFTYILEWHKSISQLHIILLCSCQPSFSVL
jgi:hypothetical protein